MHPSNPDRTSLSRQPYQFSVTTIEVKPWKRKVYDLKHKGRRLPHRRPFWSQVLTPRDRMFTGEVNTPIMHTVYEIATFRVWEVSVRKRRRRLWKVRGWEVGCLLGNLPQQIFLAKKQLPDQTGIYSSRLEKAAHGLMKSSTVSPPIIARLSPRSDSA